MFLTFPPRPPGSSSLRAALDGYSLRRRTGTDRGSCRQHADGHCCANATDNTEAARYHQRHARAHLHAPVDSHAASHIHAHAVAHIHSLPDCDATSDLHSGADLHARSNVHSGADIHACASSHIHSLSNGDAVSNANPSSH